MTVHDFRQAKKDNKIQGAYRSYNNKYKMSLLNSEKVILVSDSLYNQMKMYITYVRPIITMINFVVLSYGISLHSQQKTLSQEN